MYSRSVLKSTFIACFTLLLFHTGCKEAPDPVPDAQYFNIVMDGVQDEFSWGIDADDTPMGHLLSDSKTIEHQFTTDNGLTFILNINEMYSLEDITEGKHPLGCQFNFLIYHPSSCGTILSSVSDFEYFHITEVIPTKEGNVWIKGTISDGTGVFTPADLCIAGETVFLEDMEFTFYIKKPTASHLTGSATATIDGETITFESSRLAANSHYGGTGVTFSTHLQNGKWFFFTAKNFELISSFPHTFTDDELYFDVRSWNGCTYQWYDLREAGGDATVTMDLNSIDGVTRVSGTFEGTINAFPGGVPAIEVSDGTFEVEY